MTEAGSRRFWVSLILGFFAIDITIAVVAITMAAGDPSFRSIPGFGKRSVQWSERQQSLKHFKESGLQVEIDTEKSTNDVLVLNITDKDGKHVSGLNWTVEVFHFTRVAEQQRVEVVERDGVYTAALTMKKPGFWHLELSGTVDGKSLWMERTIDWKMPS
ncbi:MAG: FixH family protein [Pirellula sp.]|jgi:nitrogen fixation protein FixH|nr:FixH family protein [Pirellula sp.]